ncbi:MAG: class I SAM-dependent methyltransferase [Balneolales bacterium]|nr:class I SAM-dependent methyltransferase [Balneolales bacterium]
MHIDESFAKEIAAQLRKPEGELGLEVAKRMNESNKAMNLQTIELLNIQDNQLILEIGMGNGAFISNILNAASNIKYVGCDYSNDMVELASELNAKFVERGVVSFFNASVDKLPVSNHSVDTIFTVNTLYFWKEYSNTFSEFKRVLKPDGMIAITIRPKHTMHNYPPTRYNFNSFTENDLSDLLTENGFKVIRIAHKTEPEADINGNLFNPEFMVALATPDHQNT